ncbi:MAG: hypothetical protein ACOY45_00640 [Pseudomonadota bacterium]
MRKSSNRRTLYAAIIALAAGFLVAFDNPVEHVRADLHADGRSVASSIELAARMVLRSAEDRPVSL